MDCKRYEKWLTDAAIEALDPPRQRELEAHVIACGKCRAQLRREQSLLASIDSALAEGLDAELPSGFAARVRVRLSEQMVAPRSWSASWIPLMTGAAIVAVLAIAASIGWQTRARRSPESGIRSQVSGGKSLRRDDAVAIGSLQKTRQRVNLHSEGGHPRGGRRSDAVPKVLVDKSQWAAIVLLYHSAQSGHGDHLPLGAKQDQAADLLLKPIEIKPLETPPKLDAGLKPLARASEDESR